VVRVTGSLPDCAVADDQAGHLAGHLLAAPAGSALRGAAGAVRALIRPPRGWLAWPGWLDVAWAVLWVLGLAGIVLFGRWEAVPFHLIWIGFGLLYSFRLRSTRSTMWVLAAMIATTFAAIALDVSRGAQPADELTEVPLMAAMFWVMMWHGHRRLAASAEYVRVSEQTERLLATQRRFLQDASHQLRTPITIALGHSELLARSVASNQDRRDINVIVGELNRLRALSERLLLIAAAENPEFLQPEPVALDELAAEIIRRWHPAADRDWQLGRLDHVVVQADRERLGLALDALLENAVRYTTRGDTIRLSARRRPAEAVAELAVEDSGAGIPPAELDGIFDRFATGSAAPGGRGTGLGLSLVRAVAAGHGGDARVHSTLGAGSRFELLLPVTAGLPAGTVPTGSGPETWMEADDAR